MVETLADSVLGLTEIAVRFGRAEASVGDLTAELAEKYVTIVGL